MLLAHGTSLEAALPIAPGVVAAAIGLVLVGVSALLLRVWTEPRWQDAVDAPEPGPTERGPLGWVAAAVGLAVFVVVIAATFAGPEQGDFNIATWTVFSLVWAGGLVLSGFLGDVYRPFDPLRTLSATLPGEWGPDDAPRGVVPATVLLVGFVWVEFVTPIPQTPRVLGGVLLGGLAVVHLPGLVLGRGWVWGADPIARLLSTLARSGPVHRDTDGRLTVGAPLRRLPALRHVPGLTALLLVALGASLFDAMRDAELYTALGTSLGFTVVEIPRWDQVPFATGLLAMLVAVSGLAWRLAIRSAARDSGQDAAELSRSFTHVLVPLVIAFSIALSIGALAIDLQRLWILASDPFGRGWDLFGTARGSIRLDLISATTAAWVQVASILAGGLAAVVLAHDRSVARFEGETVQTAQTGLLVAIVFFTVGGMMLLLGT